MVLFRRVVVYSSYDVHSDFPACNQVVKHPEHEEWLTKESERLKQADSFVPLNL
jgi:hypothetical protein